MDKHHPRPMCSTPRRVTDQAEAGAPGPHDRRVEVRNFNCDVMHSPTPGSQEPLEGIIRSERFDELDRAETDRDKHHANALGRKALQSLGREPKPVAEHLPGILEVPDKDSQVGKPGSRHIIRSFLPAGHRMRAR